MKILHLISYGLGISFMASFSSVASVDAESISTVLQKESVVSGVGGQKALGKTLLDLSLPIPSSGRSEQKQPDEYKIMPRSEGKNLKLGHKSLSTDDRVKNFDEQKEINKFFPAGKDKPFYIVNGTLNHEKKNEITIAKNTWSIQRGSNLFNVLSEWASDAGWSLVWKPDVSYQVLSTATFHGDFSSAVQQLFSSKGLDELNIYVRFYTGNKVLLVTSEPF
ncbi:hypothetical protein YT03_004201 [Salmonella enterica subsp. enterica]|nr:hypothetical protein [Salmonella enterica subsp. enterica serovar Sandiego]